jgi:hypothetical protein
MLVTDIQMLRPQHHGNYLIEQMGKYRCVPPTFSNDLELLKFPKIKEFDAVFLNNICGMVYNDPEVRASILRYVQEGGAWAATAVTFANNNWRIRRDDGRLGQCAPHGTQVIRLTTQTVR